MTTFSRRRHRRDGQSWDPSDDSKAQDADPPGSLAPAGDVQSMSTGDSLQDLIDGVGAPPAVEHRLETLPGVLVVVREDGRVQQASKECEQLFGVLPDRLVGTDLYSLIDPDDHVVLRWTIDRPVTGAPAPRRAMLAPPLVRIRTPGSGIRLAELWATGRSDRDAVPGIVVLLRERSVLYGINSALAWVLDGAPLAEGLLVVARVLACQPVGHTCFFVTADSATRRAERVPDDPAVPGPPAAGPWTLALWSALSSEHSMLAGLSPELQGAARASGYAALRCYPVTSPGSQQVHAALVAWSREEGALSEEVQAMLRRALMAAGIALTMRPEEWELSAADRVGTEDRDPLTGLPNDSALVRSLEAMLADDGHPAVLCIGLRGLEAIHEAFGPLAAGTVERVAAQRVHSKIRRTDDVYRYSEGTLAVIYDGKLAADRLRAVAERILAHVTTPVRFGTSNVAEIEASVGISSPSMATVTGVDLVREALTALERAWRQGPNKISITVPSITR